MISAASVRPEPPPPCPSCARPMRYYGGTTGYVCCEWKLLHRAGGWFDRHGRHVRDSRLAVAGRRP